MRTTLLDTNVLYGAADISDSYHSASVELLMTLPGRLLLPASVLTETSWLIERYLGADREATFLESVAAGEIELADLTVDDVARAAQLVRRYSDFPLGVVDASIIAIAERLGVHQVATFDRRHFTAVRPRHVRTLTLLPE